MSSDLAWEKGMINMDSVIRFSRDTLVFLRLKGSLTFKENCGELNYYYLIVRRRLVFFPDAFTALGCFEYG
jgi:hypothetical protein